MSLKPPFIVAEKSFQPLKENVFVQNPQSMFFEARGVGGAAGKSRTETKTGGESKPAPVGLHVTDGD